MSGNVVTVCRSGNLLAISAQGGQEALPEAARRVLEPYLRYEKKKLLYGANRYDRNTGFKHNKVEVVDKQCFRYDTFGRMITTFGFVYRIVGLLKNADYTVQILDAVIERERPDCYDIDMDNVEKHFHYRERQQDCLKAIAFKPCGVIHAPTGFGKMALVAMTCLMFPHAKIDVITRRAGLVNKLNAYLTAHIPLVGQVGDGRHEFGRVTVYTAASLHHSDFKADIVLVDEAHELLADESSANLSRFRNARMYAFTASPTGRMDGTDIRMEAIFGRVIFHLSYQEAVTLGLVVPIRVEWCDVKLESNPCADLEDVPKKRWGLWRNKERNAVIAAKAKSFADDEQVLILVETIEHAVYLRNHLPEYTLVYDQMEAKDWKSYQKEGLLGEAEPLMTPERKEQLRIAFEAGELKKVISTKMWSVGIDPVQLAALVRADGAASEIMDIQAPGRVARIRPDGKKEVGIVCDFRDQFDSTFMRKARQRYANYNRMGWEQTVTDTGPDIAMGDEAVLHEAEHE
jgi:superfamily II DNA or RNA helicase